MTLGIVANLTKEHLSSLLTRLLTRLSENGIKFFLSEDVQSIKDEILFKLKDTHFADEAKLFKRSDIILSIGGDGTMLATTYKARYYDKPVLGINLGKLGFLAELSYEKIDFLIDEIVNNKLIIEERMVIEGKCLKHQSVDTLYSINDIVVDKGGWPKMIDISLFIDDEYVTTFSADGLILATPTGSTGYSLSTGGPIVSPESNVITLSPICPHSLSIRPIVLAAKRKILIKAESMHKEIQVNCDGQRVFAFKPPLELEITTSAKPVKIIHTSDSSYFKTLRNKLLWGIDLRRNNQDEKEKL